MGKTRESWINICKGIATTAVVLTYIVIVPYLIIVYFKLCTVFPEIIDILVSVIGIILVISLSLRINKFYVIEKIGRSTLPIYFLHGYFVSASRLLLVKLKAPLQFGITPIITYLIVSKCPIKDFCFYPSKHIMLNRKS